jgi:hypothetical protein
VDALTLAVAFALTSEAEAAVEEVRVGAYGASDDDRIVLDDIVVVGIREVVE